MASGKLGDGRIGDSHHTVEAPKYDFTDSELWRSLAVAALLFSGNVAIIVGLANTAVASFVGSVFSFSGFVGAIVFGLAIAGGRYLSSFGIRDNDLLVTAIGVGLCQLMFGLFGGFILTLYSTELYGVSIAVAASAAIGLLMLIGMYVYTFEPDFEAYAVYSLVFFGVGIVLLLGADLILPSLSVLAFILIGIGWLFDLGYEVGMSASQRRDPLMNGIGLYVAFTGVFVHLLQLALQMLADD